LLSARLARFYGWSPGEIDSLPYSQAREYYVCIEPLLAEETLIQLTVSSYPYQKKSAAQKIEKDLRRKTRINLSGQVNKQKTTADIYHEMMRKLGV